MFNPLLHTSYQTLQLSHFTDSFKNILIFILLDQLILFFSTFTSSQPVVFSSAIAPNPHRPHVSRPYIQTVALVPFFRRPNGTFVRHPCCRLAVWFLAPLPVCDLWPNTQGGGISLFAGPLSFLPGPLWRPFFFFCSKLSFCRTPLSGAKNFDDIFCWKLPFCMTPLFGASNFYAFFG